MRPTTPQEFANCYGVFIADLVIVAPNVPTVLTWLRTTLPDVESAYKLNSALFSGYTATISALPRKPKTTTTIIRRPRSIGDSGISSITSTDDPKAASAYNKALSIVWAGLIIDLTSALTCAGVDPAQVAKILASFKQLKPPQISVSK